MTGFEAWIGREVRARDRLDEGLAARWLLRICFKIWLKL